MIEFKVGGRKVSSKDWAKELEREAIDRAMETLADQIYGAAASIVDPETGKHPAVRVRRVGQTGLTIQTEGSALYALSEAKLASPSKEMAGRSWCCAHFRIDQRTKRYVRQND